MITAERLREEFLYDHETGEFSKGGKRVGCVYGNGYIYLHTQERKLLAHRVAWVLMTGEWPKHQIDHIDGNRTNNRFANLRPSTPLGNSGNRGTNRNNRSGYKGVLPPVGGRWTAQISVHGRHTHLGCFASAQAAARAYDDAAERHFGAFAKTNRMLGLL